MFKPINDREEIVFLDQCEYAIMAYTIDINEDEQEELQVMHFVPYKSPISDMDIMSISEDLNTNPQHELVGRIGVDVFVGEAPPDIISAVKRKLKMGLYTVSKTE